MKEGKRIAVLLHGGIGTGHFAQGYPMLEKLLAGWAVNFDISVFSQWSAQPDYHAEHFKFFAPNPKYSNGGFRWLMALRLLMAEHRKEPFDQLVAFWGFPAGFLATVLSKILAIRCTVCLLGGDATGIASVGFGILHRPVLRPFALWTYRNSSNLVALTEYQALHVKQYGIKREIITIPWGTETGMFTFSPKPLSNVLHCLHVGHLTPVKDQTTLLKCFAQISSQIPAELRIIGEDTMNGSIQQLANELGVDAKMTFMKMMPYAQIHELYEWADCLLHTSLYEGQSMALTEAAASGVLLAGTNVGILHDLGERCGVVVQPGDYHSLANKLLDLRRSQTAWKMKIEEAHQWSVTHDLNWTIRQFSDLLIG